MGVVIPHRAIDAISNASNPKQAILDFVGDLSRVRVPQNRILVATYLRPEKTKGGIIRPDTNKEEDLWQGKVGLVLKWGSQAYQDDGEYIWNEEDKAKVGEWVVYKVGDAWSVTLKGFPCRMIRDSSIALIHPDDPTFVF